MRYVVTATSPSGVENVLYEGLRCDTGEATTYARWNSSEQRWTMQQSWTWRPISGLAVTRIALKLAQTGMCDGRTPNGPVPRTPASAQALLSTRLVRWIISGSAA